MLMKRIYCFAVLLQFCLTMFGQATELVITTPEEGSLSSQISAEDQATVRSLKVIGNINSDDLAFVGSLICKNLRGNIDLSDAIIQIIQGRNPFNLPDPGEDYPIVEKLLLPKSLEQISGDYWFSNYMKFDTLVFDTKIKTIGNAFVRCSRHLVLGENVDSIKGPIINYTVAPWSCETIEIKGSPTYLDRFIYDETNSFTLSPDNVKHLENVEHLGHVAFGGSRDSYGNVCNQNVILDIDTIRFPNIRSFHVNSFTYHSGFHLFLGENLEEVFFDSNPDKYNADGVTFHIAARVPPKKDSGFAWITGDYKILVPKESLKDYVKNNWPHVYAEPVPLTGIDIKPTNVIVEVGETRQLTANPIPANADDNEFTWSSSNEDVVKVSDSGEITAIASGEAVITVSSKNGEIENSLSVIVATHVTGIKLSEEKCQLENIGDKVVLNAIVAPANATYKDVIWSSSNENVCIVNDGLVTAIAPGQATITVTTVDGEYTANCIVKVIQHVTNVEVNKATLSLKVGEAERLSATVLPDNADDKSVIWSSSDEQVAIVDDKGNVTALKAGVIDIKAESVDNPEAYDICEVTVLQPATGISLNMQKCTLTSIGESAELVATVTPEDASNKNVKWKSTDESVCIVANGTVVAVGSGVCVIIATSEDGGHMATCTVTVNIYDSVKGVNGAETITIESISDAAGRRINTLQRGVNILRMSDGTTKKVMVK